MSHARGCGQLRKTRGRAERSACGRSDRQDRHGRQKHAHADDTSERSQPQPPHHGGGLPEVLSDRTAHNGDGRAAGLLPAPSQAHRRRTDKAGIRVALRAYTTRGYRVARRPRRRAGTRDVRGDHGQVLQRRADRRRAQDNGRAQARVAGRRTPRPAGRDV